MRQSGRTNNTPAAIFAGCLLLVGVIAALWLMHQPPKPLLERIQQDGVLVVASRHSPSTYFDGPDGPDGFEYALVHAFADRLGVEVRFVFPSTLDTLIDAVRRGAVHMAAAGLTVTPARERLLAFSVPYDRVNEELVYRRGSERPKTLDDIGPGDLHVVAGSSHEETLQQLQGLTHAGLNWSQHAGAGVEGLLREVDRGSLRLTVADSHTAELYRRIYRHTATAFALREDQSIAWAFNNGNDSSLRDAADGFLQQMEIDGRLQRLRARYFGHSGRLNFVDSRDFWRAVRDRLPTYRGYFERAAERTGIDWRLLAAIGYQESHWRPDAVSPTGVRGIMMLTQATAKQMKITDRNDPGQSIIGGARYLRVIEKKIPERIRPPNRLWLTLAGYNIGFGHLEDARVLTDRDGADPDLWLEVKQRLPRLSKRKYFETVRHGFARGQEPVDYVDNIRNYYDLLVWYTNSRNHQTIELLLAEGPERSTDP